MSVIYLGPDRARRRMSWFLLFLVGVALMITLYFVKTHAQSAKRDVRQLSAAIASEEAAIRVLKAELAYLESPVRVSELNEAHLALEPVLPEQEKTRGDIERLFPLLTTDEGGVAP